VVDLVVAVVAVVVEPDARPRWRCGSRSLAVAVVLAELVVLAVVTDVTLGGGGRRARGRGGRGP
jgi:hypothetical protein